MNIPKVSIVTPSYNQADFLERTILSIIKQDYPNIEYIIIDGGSTDGSVDIIKKYQSKLAYWVSEKDNGQSNAINKGFSKATGSIYCWINSDDILMPNAVSIAVNYLNKMADVGLVYADRIVINKNDQILYYLRYPKFNKVLFKYYNPFAQETGFFRKDIWDKVGGVDENLYYSMDKDLWFKYLSNSKLYHIPFVLGAYRWHSAAKCVLKISDKNLKEINYNENLIVYKRYLGNVYKNKFLIRIFSIIAKIRLIMEPYSKAYKKELQEIIRFIDL